MAIGSLSTAGPASLDPRGPAANDLAVLWWVLLGLGATVFVAVAVLLVIAVIRRGRGAPADVEPAEVPARTANRWIVGLGIVVPTVLLIAVLVLSVAAMRRISQAAPDDAVVIDVVGHQFWWSATYVEEGFTVANELHIPVDEPVEVRLTSADVIHSFWTPQLHGKLDLLPDGTNTLVLEADEPGVYGGACAEFCGLQHANMNFLVIAQPAAEFAAWVDGQQRPAAEPATADATRGRGVFEAEQCASCHTVRGVAEAPEDAEVIGPDLTHVASRRTLAADTIANTPEDLARWLSDPDAIKVGTTMPAPNLSADEITALVAYLRELE